MKKNIKTFCLSLLASVCFFASYFIHGETLNLILACVWLLITIIIGFSRNKNNK